MTTELEVLSPLADPTRWELMDRIAAGDSATATALADGLPVSRQAIVKHLGVLERAGLVDGRRAGREMRYSVRVEQLDATAKWMAAAARRWDNRLAAIKRQAETGPASGEEGAH